MVFADIWINLCYDIDLEVYLRNGERGLKVPNTDIIFPTNKTRPFFLGSKYETDDKNHVISKSSSSWYRDGKEGEIYSFTLTLRKSLNNVLGEKIRYNFPEYSHKIYIFEKGELEEILENSKDEFVDLLNEDDISIDEKLLYHIFYFVSPHHSGD